MKTDLTRHLKLEDLSESERTRAEVWTRVMGYHRPVSAFNPGKQQEYRDRVMYQESLVRFDQEPFQPLGDHPTHSAGADPAPYPAFVGAL